jgi:sugar phosphate isomerase/epimerase
VAAPGVATNSLMAMVGDFESNLKFLGHLGFTGIELLVNDTENIDISYLKALLKENNLKIAAVSVTPLVIETGLVLASPDREVRKEALSKAFEVIKFASKFDAPFCIGRFKGNIDQKSSDNDYEATAETYRKICLKAAESGTEVFFEPQGAAGGNYLNTVREGLEWVNKVGCGNLHLILDLYHLSNNEQSIFFSIQRALGKIGFIHTCDSKRLMMGFGDLPVREFIGAILATGFKGYFSVEVKQEPDQETAAFMSYQFFNYLQKIIFI